MKRTANYIIQISLIMLPASLRADYDDTGAGALAIAMGNSFTALSDDVFGMYYNPAGLGFIQTSQIGTDLGELYVGLGDNSTMMSGFSGMVLPIIKVKEIELPSSGSSVDVSTGVLTLPGLGGSSSPQKKITTYRHLGTFGVGMKYFSLVNYYQEAAYYLSYGRPVSNKWAWGISAKMLQEKYILDDYMKLSPVFNYGNKDSISAVSVDAGLLYNISPRFFAGVSVLDLNQPNLGLEFQDLLPCTVRTGLAWRDKGVAWALDAVYRDNLWYYSTGFEKFVCDIFAARMGVAYGGNDSFNISMGFGLNLSRVELDYAFQYPIIGITNTSGTHRISLVFRFGRKKKEELEVGSLEYYYEKAKDNVSALSQKLAQTTTEKENLEKILIEESTMRIRERIKAAKIDAHGPQAAQSSQSEAKESRETHHIVRSEETLQSIALKYFGDEKYWNDIFQANKDNIGRGGALKVGQVLIIPMAARQEVQSASIGSSAASQVTQVTAVKVVDQASPFASQAVSPKEMAAPVKVIPIMVNSQNVAVDNKPAETKKTAEKAQKSKPKKYVVQEGDNLRSIAQKYYNDPKRWKEIYKANKDKIISGQLTPGQEIIIP